ncbi:MAG TPA: hypothetical protein VFS10_03030 [Pyrinomonadaceae bacterium]|nr:hypothetical protein [Pyrinomonadaceae bacterium]
MTPQDHNKTIGIMHLVYGGFHALTLGAVALVFILLGLGAGSSNPGDAGDIALGFGIIVTIVLIAFAVFGLLPLLAGLGLLRRKSWARTVGIVSSILMMLNMPFGMALGIYTLWFLMSEGKVFHESRPAREDWRGALPNASTFGWDAQSASRTRPPYEYVPPPQPPNWRDES